MPHRCVLARAALFTAPDAAGPMASELLAGEPFELLEVRDGWAWGRSGRDSYAGYLRAEALCAVAPEPTHRVSVPSALVFERPDLKSPVIDRLPLNALVAARPHAPDFVARDGSGFLHRRHVAPVDAPPDPDPGGLARGFIGTPYLWGGRTRDGIDCSGLVQALLLAAGHPCPRDSDMQRSIGDPVPPHSAAAGDLVFVPGHVGLLLDSARLLHANAHWMSTVVEPLRDVVERLRPIHPEPILAVRRVQALRPIAGALSGAL